MTCRALLGIASLVVIAILGISFAVAFPFGRDHAMRGVSEKEKTEMQEFGKAVQQAIEDKNYEAWKSLMGQEIAKMQAQVTEENFNKIIGQHQQKGAVQGEQNAIQAAIEAGDFSSWKTLMEAQITETNFNKLVERFQKMNETRGEMRNVPKNLPKIPGLNGNEKALKEAIANNDYSTWKSLMEAQITEEHFNKLVEMHKKRAEQREGNEEIMKAVKEARKSGDFEKMKEIGFKGPCKHNPFGRDHFRGGFVPEQAE